MFKALFAAFLAASLVAATVATWPSVGSQLISDGGSSGAPPVLPATVVLGVGDSVILPDGSVLTFVEKLEDSRCPADAMCIWQGNAVLAFDHDGDAFEVTWGASGDGAATFGSYRLAITDAQPYPLASQPHDFADTVVTITVTEA
jgi:hypothetical protein